jgi:hypothetical protein
MVYDLCIFGVYLIYVTCSGHESCFRRSEHSTYINPRPYVFALVSYITFVFFLFNKNVNRESRWNKKPLDSKFYWPAGEHNPRQILLTLAPTAVWKAVNQKSRWNKKAVGFKRARPLHPTYPGSPPRNVVLPARVVRTNCNRRCDCGRQLRTPDVCYIHKDSNATPMPCMYQYHIPVLKCHLPIQLSVL